MPVDDAAVRAALGVSYFRNCSPTFVLISKKTTTEVEF